MSALSFETLAKLAGRPGIVDAPCPLCGPEARAPVNQRRKVLRIWHDGEFTTYKCARCDAHGWARADAESAAPRHEHIELPPQQDKSALAAALWNRSAPARGTPVETYLRSRAVWHDLSGEVRFLPARGQHPPAMLMRFGAGPTVTGIHITRLAPDGSSKAGTDADKLTLGSSVGQPIIVHDNPERIEHAITEGIEDARSIALCTGWTCWAAGSSGRIPTIIAAAPKSARLYLAVDHDKPTKARPQGDGAYRLMQSRKIRPDIIPLHFGKAFGAKSRFDANRTLMEYGPDAILAMIDLAEADGYEAVCRAHRRIDALIGTGLEL